MFTRIVVGSDGSSESRDAVVLGARIAAATGAGLTLLESFPTSPFPAPGYTDRRTAERDARGRLAADRERYAPDALIKAVADGSPARALRHYAESWNADLVIVGSAGSAELGTAAISSTGRELLAHAPFAVAIAERGIHQREYALERVGLGYDGGPESEIALQVAAAVSAGPKSTLEVLAVVDDRIPTISVGEWLTMSNWDQRLEFDREQALELAQKAASQTAVTSNVQAVLADPRNYLRRASDDLDLMVIGSRRWGTLARVVLGGVGESLATSCGCSLIVTRRASAPGDERAAEEDAAGNDVSAAPSVPPGEAR